MSSVLKYIGSRLCKFSGEDYTIIQKCNTKIQLVFSFIGFFVLIILVCCFVSALYFTEHLFHSVITDIGVGLVWGYIVTNLYVLLLYTITPTLLPKKERKKKLIKTASFRLNTSLVLRGGIVVLLAIITAQPLNVYILEPESMAFAKSIKTLLSHNFRAWIITVLVIGVFLLPIYLKYNIRKLGEFYEKKALVKKKIIEDNYREFKQAYKNILDEKFQDYNRGLQNTLIGYLDKIKILNPVLYHKINEDLKQEIDDNSAGKYEYWANAPYRTIQKKQTIDILTEEELLKLIYPPRN